MLAPEATFKPVVPGEAVATLVLIENSQAMVNCWPDLHDRHLPTLLGTVRLANPIVPIQVLWLTTSPVVDDESLLSHYTELPDIGFDLHEDNKISPTIINRGITLLASTFKGQLAARHLFVVAASSPTQTDPSSNGSSTSEWQHIAQKLQEERIFLHIVLSPAQNMDLFNWLYYDALIRQNHQEVLPWFNPMKYQIRLAGSSNLLRQFEAQPVANDAVALVSNSEVPDIPLPPLYRNPVYPLDAVDSPQGSCASTSESQRDVSIPSLVTRLQNMHGMTKKKIYGSQATRQPFIRDKRLDYKYPQTSTLLSIPPLPRSLPNAEKSKLTKTQRIKRLSGPKRFASSHSEASTSQNLTYHQDSQGAMPADMGLGSYLSSNMPVSALSANSPVLPAERNIDGHVNDVLSLVSVHLRPSWLRDHSDQYSVTTLSADTVSVAASDQGCNTPSYSRYSSRHLLPMSSATRDNITSAAISAQTLGVNEYTEWPVVPSPINEGDRPFILCPGYEATATAQFNALCQSSRRGSTNFPNRTSTNQYADSESVHSRDPYDVPPSAQLPFMTTFSRGQDRLQTQSNQFTQTSRSTSPTNEEFSPFSTPGGFSSLKGWDG